MNETVMRKSLEKLLNDNYIPDIHALFDNYPKRKSLTVDLNKIMETDIELYNEVINNTEEVDKEFLSVIKQTAPSTMQTEERKKVLINLRYANYGNIAAINKVIGEIDVEVVGKMISVSGIV